MRNENTDKIRLIYAACIAVIQTIKNPSQYFDEKGVFNFQHAISKHSSGTKGRRLLKCISDLIDYLNLICENGYYGADVFSIPEIHLDKYALNFGTEFTYQNDLYIAGKIDEIKTISNLTACETRLFCAQYFGLLPAHPVKLSLTDKKSVYLSIKET